MRAKLPCWRRITWVLVLWNLLAVGLVAGLVLWVRSLSGCQSDACMGTSYMSLILPILAAAVWIVGSVVLGVIWVCARPKR